MHIKYSFCCFHKYFSLCQYSLYYKDSLSHETKHEHGCACKENNVSMACRHFLPNLYAVGMTDLMEIHSIHLTHLLSNFGWHFMYQYFISTLGNIWISKGCLVSVNNVSLNIKYCLTIMFLRVKYTGN